MHLVQELLTNVQCGGGSRSSAQETSLDDEEHSGQPQEVDNNELRVSLTDPLTTTQEATQELNVNHSTVLRHWKQIGKVKKLDKWVPHELTENQKNCHFEVSSSLILSNNNNSFLNWTVMCDIKWILYDNQWRPAQWLDWVEAPKHFPKSNLHQKGVMVTVWWSAVSLTHYSFLNPSKIITSEKYAQQTDEMQWKRQHMQLALVNRVGLILRNKAPPHGTQSTLQKLNELGHKVFPHLASHQPTTTSSSTSATFLQRKCFPNQQDTKIAFQEFVESWSIDFFAPGINKLISYWQKCVDCNGSCFY